MQDEGQQELSRLAPSVQDISQDVWSSRPGLSLVSRRDSGHTLELLGGKVSNFGAGLRQASGRDTGHILDLLGSKSNTLIAGLR